MGLAAGTSMIKAVVFNPSGNARAWLTGLRTGHHFADLVAAAAEGPGLAAGDCYPTIGEVLPEVRPTGGGAGFSALRRIMVEALGASVCPVLRDEAGPAGAAMIAAGYRRLCRHLCRRVHVGQPPTWTTSWCPHPDATLREDHRSQSYTGARHQLAPG